MRRCVRLRLLTLPFTWNYPLVSNCSNETEKFYNKKMLRRAWEYLERMFQNCVQHSEHTVLEECLVYYTLAVKKN